MTVEMENVESFVEMLGSLQLAMTELIDREFSQYPFIVLGRENFMPTHEYNGEQWEIGALFKSNGDWYIDTYTDFEEIIYIDELTPNDLHASHLLSDLSVGDMAYLVDCIVEQGVGIPNA